MRCNGADGLNGLTLIHPDEWPVIARVELAGWNGDKPLCESCFWQAAAFHRIERIVEVIGFPMSAAFERLRKERWE